LACPLLPLPDLRRAKGSRELFAWSAQIDLSALVATLPKRVGNIEQVRANLRDPDDLSFIAPENVSTWAGLTDDELLRLDRKTAAANLWNLDARFGREFSGRLILALKANATAEATAGRRLELLTWALVLLTVVIAAFTVALFVHG
jgi:hypothetical protein